MLDDSQIREIHITAMKAIDQGLAGSTEQCETLRNAIILVKEVREQRHVILQLMSEIKKPMAS